MTDPTKITVRGTILERAKQLTEGDRNQAYGDPKDGMRLFASLVTDYLELEGPLRPEHAAVILCLLKISRIAANPKHMDSYVDLAAYAAIAGECAGVKGVEA